MILSDGLQFHPLPLSNFPANAAIGTAAATVDRFHAITIAQTTANITLTLPTPTELTNATHVAVINKGTVPFIIQGFLVNVGEFAMFTYVNGAWRLLSLRPPINPTTILFTASGIYTPSANMKAVIVEVIGGGGGSGATSGDGNTSNAADAGQAGGYAKAFLTRAQVLAAVGFPNIVVGAAGAGGTTSGSGTPGSAGGNSSFCGVVNGDGGAGGAGNHPTSVNTQWTPSGVPTTGGGAASVLSGLAMMIIPGCPGSPGVATQKLTGTGPGDTFFPRTAFGPGGMNKIINQSSKLGYAIPSARTASHVAVPTEQSGFGAGAHAIANVPAASNAGGAGTAGAVIITEFS